MHPSSHKIAKTTRKKSVFGEKPTYLYIVYHKTTLHTADFFVYLQIIYKKGGQNGVFLGKRTENGTFSGIKVAKKAANAWHRHRKISIK